MNKYKGDVYESHILNYLKNNEKYDYVWLWKDIPEKILHQEKIITDYAKYSLVRNDIGIDILAKKNNEYTYIQCKNFNANSICIQDLAGYFFFKMCYNKNCKVYYNGNLSNRIKIMYPGSGEFVQIPFHEELSNARIDNDKKVMEKREYQIEAQQKLKDINRSVIALPCGMGKTYISYLLAQYHDNIIFFAPTKELCVQTHEIYKKYFKEHSHNLISGDGTRNTQKIMIKKKNILISTFKSCDVINKLIDKLSNPYIIIDEYHNLSMNDLTKKSNDMYKILHSKHQILFLSATPKYLDYKDVFGNNMYSYKWQDAIKNNYINDFKIVLPDNNYINLQTDQFLNLFKLSDQNNVSQELNNKYVKKIYFILRSILYNANKKCLIYLPTIEKAKMCKSIIEWMKRLFNVNINTSIIDHTTKKSDRKEQLDNFVKNDDIYIILNVHVLDEGVNIPECDSVYIMNPSNNIENIVQRMSRCNRKMVNKGISYIYLWYKENKVKTIMDYINGNTNNELADKYIKVNFKNQDQVEEETMNNRAKQNINDEIDGLLYRENKDVQIIRDDEESQSYYHANHICKILGYEDHKQAIKINVEKENIKYLKNIVKNYKELYKNAHGSTKFLNKTGLYSLMLNSRTEKAKEIMKRIINKNILCPSNEVKK